MELFLSEEKIPAPDHWSQQSSQTLYTWLQVQVWDAV